MSNRKSGAFSRRAFSRSAAAAGALAGLAPLAQLAPRFAGAAHAQSAILERINGTSSFQMGVNEASRALKFAEKSGAAWSRWTVQWFNAEKQVGKVDPFYFQGLDNVTKNMNVAAMVVGTPDHSGAGGPTAIPTGLYEPTMLGDAPNPANRFAEFMFNLAKEYAGRIDTFEIWNEVEIPATGSNAIYNTWSGDAASYKQLVKVAGQAAKTANPGARIITSPYSYFKDAEEGKFERLPFWDSFEAAVREDPEMAALVDGVALNLYRNPHDLWDRMHGAVPDYYSAPDKKGFADRVKSMFGGFSKEMWLTEINAMPFDDAVLDWNPAAKSRDAEPLGLRLTMDEQAAYIWQALAIAVAAGWSKINFHSLVDEVQGGKIVDELWGLVRHHNDANNGDESRARPAYWAYSLASRLLGDAEFTQLLVRVRPDAVLSKHRQNASRYKWGAQAVVAQKGDLRTTVLWNNSPDLVTVQVAARGSEALLIDKMGNAQPLNTAGGNHNVTINPAHVRFSWPTSPFGVLEDPINYFYVGGDPMILIETGVGDHGVNIPGFIVKNGPENGSQPDATNQGDIVDNGPGMNPRLVGHDPARVGRLR